MPPSYVSQPRKGMPSSDNIQRDNFVRDKDKHSETARQSQLDQLMLKTNEQKLLLFLPKTQIFRKFMII